MDNHQPLDEDNIATQERRTPSRKYPWAILVVIVLFVIIPFVSWYGSWFGRPLSDSKMAEYLHDQNKPRNVQHALAQIAGRMIDHDPSAAKWYSEVIAASHNQQPEVRMTAAWVMGQDNTYEDFHPALLAALRDPVAGVRHNAALALVRFGDSSGRPELIAMLKPYAVRAENAGIVELIIKQEGAAVASGAPLVRVKQDDGKMAELHAAEAGRVEAVLVADGAKVEAASELMTLSPSTEQVWETLRALYLVGQLEDIPEIQRYTRPSPTMPDSVVKQAASTLQAIRERAESIR